MNNMKYQTILLTLLFLSGCVNSNNEHEQKSPYLENKSSSSFFLSTEADGTKLLNYKTDEGLKFIRPPKVEKFIDSFKLSVLKGNKDTLQIGWSLEYLLGNFSSDIFKRQTPFLQIEVNKDGWLDRFIIHYYFDSSTQSFVIKDMYKLDYIYGCGHELGAVYKINDRLYPKTLSQSNLKKIHTQLFSTVIHEGTKIMPNVLLSKYKKLMKNDTKESVSSLIFTDDEMSECKADEYVSLVYYFKNNPEFSYNIANFFQKYNYHEEALILLKKIIEDDPNRVASYLAIADSYYALNLKVQALKNYTIYIDKMTSLGLQKQIPQRVKILLQYEGQI